MLVEIGSPNRRFPAACTDLSHKRSQHCELHIWAVARTPLDTRINKPEELLEKRENAHQSSENCWLIQRLRCFGQIRQLAAFCIAARMVLGIPCSSFRKVILELNFECLLCTALKFDNSLLTGA